MIFRFILLSHPTKTELNLPSPEKKHFLESVFSCCWVSTVGIFSKSTDIFSKQIYERILYREKQWYLYKGWVWAAFWLNGPYSHRLLSFFAEARRKLVEVHGRLKFHTSLIPQYRILYSEFRMPKCLWQLPLFTETCHCPEHSPTTFPELSAAPCTGSCSYRPAVATQLIYIAHPWSATGQYHLSFF